MRRLLILLLLVSLTAPLAAWAQETPPIPRARPDRGEDVAPQPVQPMNQGDPEHGNAALDALAEALRSREQTPETSSPSAGGPPLSVTLSAKISEDGAIIPDGLTWRVFDTKTDATGQLALLGKSVNSIAVFDLPPGDYVVHVAYGRSQATDTMHIEAGVTGKTIILDSGALRLGAAISGDIPIPDNDLKFDIFATSDGEHDRSLVADGIKPGDMVHLNAGVYHIISRFGKYNALVRADLRVEPGQITDATLYHRAARVSLKLVSDEGGEAIADVEWTIKSAEGDVIYSNVSAFPSLVLEEGDYSVVAKRGTNVYNRDFNVHAGSPTEIEVLTSVY
ncbi:hypothetical protein [Mariluticola halotolerans]|uniref:hypothetical protein n=1 Tax=Mariluticola halotolerans TaxID=2909283 RepID=UPI0026E2AB53|nr:hypothetical protein [Mariluticola halotolerans]UJQ95329.1 hypothetical protein L1P08_04915 [Mariluticola halotolerans]